MDAFGRHDVPFRAAGLMSLSHRGVDTERPEERRSSLSCRSKESPTSPLPLELFRLVIVLSASGVPITQLSDVIASRFLPITSR
jgi:hypothetical protein